MIALQRCECGGLIWPWQTRVFDSELGGFIHLACTEPLPEPRFKVAYDDYELRVYDDQPVADGQTYAADQRVVLLRGGEIEREFLYPAYRIYTLLAHWKDGLS